MQSSVSTKARVQDYLWLAVAVLLAGLFVLTALSLVAFVVTQDWTRVLLTPISLLATFWFCGGAWRCTCWGAHRQTVEAP